jgi:predicted phage terminase large subunit-like protein
MGGHVQRKIREQNERNQFDELVRERLERKKREDQARRVNSENLSVLDFVPRLSPELEAPRWLGKYADALELGAAFAANDNQLAARQAISSAPGSDGPLRLVLAAPPQHGKTELTLHALIWVALKYPKLRHAYVTYSKERAEYVSRKFELLAEQAGLLPQGNLADVRLKGGTEIRFTSVGGALTGFTVDGLLVIDDPFKDRPAAESSRLRKRVQEWFADVARSRRAPRTAIIVMATRWHPDDLSGWLVTKKSYRYVNFKAIAEGPHNDNGVVLDDPNGRKVGESLWSYKPPEFFEEERKDAYTWASLYQGEPRPRGGKVFGVPGQYRELPKKGYRGAFGLDLAYSEKTHADFSICVEGWVDDEGRIYIVHVDRKQVDAPSFALTLKANKTRRPGWKMRWYAAGTEKGAADFLKRQGIPLIVKPPKGDKFVRSIETAAEWNAGMILVPDTADMDAPWLPAFLDVIMNFTGVNDLNDDDVDAMTACRDELRKKTGTDGDDGDGGLVTFTRG